MSAVITPEQQAVLDAIDPYINAFQITYCCCVSIAVWELFINAKREYEKIWLAPWSAVKMCYLVSRYGTLAVYLCYVYYYTGKFTQAECDPAYLLGPVMSTIPIAATQGILLLRTYALYGKNNLVLAFLGFLLLASFTISITMAATQILPFPALPGGGPCLPTGTTKLVAYFFAPMVFDLCVTGLQVYRGFTLHKRGARRTPLLTVFFRDGILYYICVTALNLLNSILWQVAPDLLKSQAATPAIVLSSVLGTRLVLSLKDREGSDGISWGSSGNPFNSARRPGSSFPATHLPDISKTTRSDSVNTFGEKDIALEEGHGLPTFPITVNVERTVAVSH